MCPIELYSVRQWDIPLSFESTLQCKAILKPYKMLNLKSSFWKSFCSYPMFCYHFMHPLHLVQCADFILNDKYNDHFIYYFMEYLTVSVLHGWFVIDLNSCVEKWNLCTICHHHHDVLSNLWQTGSQPPPLSELQQLLTGISFEMYYLE